MQQVAKSKYLDLNCENSKKMLDDIKKYINKYECPKISLDLTKLNILDAARIMVLSSAYHYKKYPNGKITCRVQSDNVKNFISGLTTENLEIYA